MVGRDIPFYCTSSKIIIVKISKKILLFVENKNNLKKCQINLWKLIKYWTKACQINLGIKVCGFI
jgi:hypothetical protein